MYYTDDACLWQFTPQQKGVIWHTLFTSRAGLLSGAACSSSFPELAGLQQFKLFPNPFEKQLCIQWQGVLTEEVRLFLYDACGRLLMQHFLPVGTSTYEMDLRHLPSGLYFLAVQSSSGEKKVEKIEKWP